jgi:hypothetical protein
MCALHKNRHIRTPLIKVPFLICTHIFSRKRESRKVSTCYRSKRAFGDLKTFVTGELKSRAKSTLIEHPKAN